MREIKFRAIQRDDKGNIIIKDSFDIYTIKEICLYDWTGDNVEFQQYTGLKDKNGKEIYEGDIIKFTQGLFNTNPESYPTKIKKVKWDRTCGAWNVYETSAGETNIEVIGNIYENEL